MLSYLHDRVDVANWLIKYTPQDTINTQDNVSIKKTDDSSVSNEKTLVTWKTRFVYEERHLYDKITKLFELLTWMQDI